METLCQDAGEWSSVPAEAGTQSNLLAVPRPSPGYMVGHGQAGLCLHRRQPPQRHDLYRSHQRPPARIHEHRTGAIPGFTRRYGCKMLVWYQAFDQLDSARHRELQMKEWKRAWKLRLIEEMNPDWNDLYDTLF